MPCKEKTERNLEIVHKHKNGWSFRRLAGHFNINVKTVYDIYKRTLDKK